MGGGAVPGPWYYLAVQPTNRRLRLPASIACHKYINPKCKCWINLIIHTNGIHKVNSIILNGPFFYLVWDETRWLVLNAHLSYKPPSSCRILVQYGGHPRQFSKLKKFRALVVLGRCLRKDIIIKGVLAPTEFLTNGHSSFIRSLFNSNVCPYKNTEE